MSWRTPTEADLVATLSQKEIETFKRSSPMDAADPVSLLITRTAELVRGYLRTGGVAMSPTAATIPEGLISPAMDYAAFDVLKRIAVPISKERADARRDAVTLFNAVAKGEHKPEAYGETDDSGGGVSPTFTVPTHVLD